MSYNNLLIIKRSHTHSAACMKEPQVQENVCKYYEIIVSKKTTENVIMHMRSGVSPADNITQITCSKK